MSSLELHTFETETPRDKNLLNPVKSQNKDGSYNNKIKFIIKVPWVTDLVIYELQSYRYSSTLNKSVSLVHFPFHHQYINQLPLFSFLVVSDYKLK